MSRCSWLPAGPLGRRVQRHRRTIKAVAAAHGADNVRVFGSVARGADHPDSDIDLLFDIPAGTGLFTLGRLRRDLEELLHASVDVVPADGLKPEVRALMETDLIPL